MKKRYVLLIMALFLLTCRAWCDDVFIEAESFEKKGGWVIDTQSTSVMGSPYLLAHGLGVPVQDATTSFSLSKAAEYRLWVRTRDWTRTWGRTESAGRFQVLLNGKSANPLFGTKNKEWDWQDGGVIFLPKGRNSIALRDLTGFEGRCDAIYLTSRLESEPPSKGDELALFRQKKTRCGALASGGEYDLVVVGGGIAGCCAAVSAARLGCRVALIQNRPVLGGNNSSEVRVGLSGLINKSPYPQLGNLMDELGGVGYWTYQEAIQDSSSERSKQILNIMNLHPEKNIHNAGPASNYEDEKKLRLVESEPLVTLFLNTEIIRVKMRKGQIREVIGKNIESGKETCFRGALFADCTGDGNLGYLAGADFRMGRESREETQEASAPDQADRLTMGTSVQWYAEETESPQPFPDCPWAVEFNETNCFPIVHGEWMWETGLERNQITETEQIRDYALRAVYGNWSYMKNHSTRQQEFSQKRLAWVAYIGGKRESRRLLGDVVLTEQDVLGRIPYDDASFTTTWPIDLHYPERIAGIKEEPFTAYSESKPIQPYAVPYRCLYSRNVENLFMAGRNISVTHIALGTVRVMRTGGMMGEVVGMAASICKRHKVLPRSVYADYLSELKELMKRGVGTPGFPDN